MSTTFKPAVPYTTGFSPSSVSVADVNGDGKLDLVTANYGGNSLSVLLGNGDGTFQPKSDYATGVEPVSVTTADVNGDGKLDLLVANDSSHLVSVLLGNGNGTFQPKADLVAGLFPYWVTAADVNGDGKLDLVVANEASNSVSVLLGNGTGTFQAKTDYDTGFFPNSVIAADVNGDGKPDLLVADGGNNFVSVLLGNGSGAFPTRTDYAVGAFPSSVTAADVNGDGKLDLVVANQDDNTVSVLLGNGDGSFQATTDYLTGSSPQSVTVADVNGDGKLDLVVANHGSNTVSLLLGNGDGTFQARTDYATGPSPKSVTVADVNSDGQLDLLVAVEGSNQVDVLLGERPDPVIGITASPSFGGDLKAGSSVVFTLTTAAPVVASGTPELTLSNNAVASYSGTDGGGHLQFTYSVNSGDDTSDLTVTGLSLNGGTIGVPSQTTFAAHQDYAAGSNPSSVTTADMNGDGKLDLVVANELSNSVSVLLGNGNGTFQAKMDYATGTNPDFVTAADVNGDGKLDLVVSNIGGQSISVLLGDGSGAFPTKTDYATAIGAGAVTAADVNGDGKLDLLVADHGSNTVSVFLGNGNGTFQAKVDYATESSPFSVTAADVNRDGKLDLVVANVGSNDVSVLLGNGNGTFQTKVDYAAGFGAGSVTAADLNGDGKLDLVVANQEDNTVSVLLGNGNGTFQAKTDYDTPAGSLPASVRVADVNGDGKLDLIVANELGGGVSLFLGNGNGSFQARMDYATASRPDSLSVADVNGDGRLDLVTANDGSNNVSVLLNTSTAALTFDASSIASLLGANTGIVIDTIAPSAPSLSLTNDTGSFSSDLITSDPSITYTASASGDTLLYKLDNGSFSTTVPVLATDGSAEGQHTVSVEEQDAAGNISQAASLTFTLDTIAPSAPSLALSHDTGSSNSDLITSDPSITYMASASGDTLLYKLDNGTFSTTVPVLATNGSAEGQHTVSVEEQDAAGNISQAASLTFTLDTIAPSAPSLALSHDTGSSNSDLITSDPSITYTASASGDTLLYKLDNGSFSTTVPVLATDGSAEGQHTVSVEEQDAAGNISQAASLTFTLDTIAPSAPSPALSHDTGSSNSDLVTSDPSITYTASASGDTLLYKLENSSFSTTVPVLAADGSAEGQHTVSVEEQDAAGNISQAASLTFTLDTTAPTLTSITVAPDTGDSNSDHLTNAATLTYTLTFSEAVTGLDLSDFTLNPSSTDTAASLQSVAGSGDTWTLTVATGGAGNDGTIAFAFNGQTVSDLAGNGFGGGVFEDAGTLSAGTTPAALALADVDGDGQLDIVVADQGSNSVSILHLGSPPTTAAVGTFPTSVMVGDVNGDGHLDIVAANGLDNSVSVLLGNGDGTFLAQRTDATGRAPLSVTLGDVNGDGHLDIVTANENDNTVSVLLGNGDGTFLAAPPDAVGSAPFSVALGDVNGDGHLDIVTANQGSDTVSVLLGNGNGTFQAQPDTAVGGVAPISVALGDVNGDGHLDIVTANQVTNTVSVLLGNGDGTFQPQATDAVGSHPFSVTLGDVNGDGRLDIVTANQASSTVSVLLGNGNGTFQTQTTDPAGFHTTAVALGDLNGDGRPDIVTNDASEDLVALLLNQSQPLAAPVVTFDGTAPTLTVTGIAPDAGTSPSDGLTNAGTVTVSGTIDAGDGNQTVTVFDGAANLGTATLDGVGGWSLSGVALSAGDNHLSASATDAAGNTGTSAIFTATLDQTPPAQPTVALAHDTGSSSNDGITRDPTLTFSAPVGSDTVLYNVDGGGFSITAPVFATNGTADGPHTVSVEEQDATGNTSTAASLTFTLDTIAPVVTTVNAVSASNDLGLGQSVTFDLVFDSAITVAGGIPSLTLSNGETATLTGSDATDLVFGYAVQPGDDTANLTIATVNLNGATVQDAAGNNANLAAAVPGVAGLKVDATAPTVTVGLVGVTPVPGANNFNAPPTDIGIGGSITFQLVSTESFTLAGGSPTLTLSNGAIATLTSSSSTELNFIYTVQAGHNEDTQDLSIASVDLNGTTVRDAAGNDADFSAVVPGITGFAQIDAIVPAAPLFDHLTFHAGTETLTGTAEAGSTIAIALDGHPPQTVAADGTGAWAISGAALPTGAHSFTATATEAAGNVSASSTFDVDVLTGVRAGYLIETTEGNDHALHTHITDAAAGGTAQTLTGVEALQFDDGAFMNDGADLNRTANFDGGRFDDVLFQHDGDGQLTFAHMNNGTVIGFANATASIGNFAVGGTGDINGDGFADVFVQDPTHGGLYVAEQAGTGTPTWVPIAPGLPADFTLVGAGDLNGDGFADAVVQQQGSGTVDYAAIVNGAFSSWQPVAQNLGNFYVTGIGDVNGDGFADVVVQDQGGQNQIDYASMAGGVFSGWTQVAVAPGWQVAAVADLNGDGNADVVVRDTAPGLNIPVFADMHDGVFSGWVAAATAIDQSWQIKAVADVNNDGFADLILQQTTTGETVFAAEGPNGFDHWGNLQAPPGANWHVV